MVAYLKLAKAKSEQFKKYSIEQIPRDQNTQADALANLGSTFNEPSLDSVSTIHLETTSIEKEDVTQIKNKGYN